MDSPGTSPTDWPLYRFMGPGGAELEQGHLEDDDSAEAHGREISASEQVPVTIERRGHVDWEYVTEEDERS